MPLSLQNDGFQPFRLYPCRKNDFEFSNCYVDVEYVYLIRDFKEHHLGQIQTVYPSAYTFRQETGLPIAGGNRHTSQLTVEANMGKNCYKLSCLCLLLVPKYIALQYKSFCVCGSATSFYQMSCQVNRPGMLSWTSMGDRC